jgi:hypothetical protein
MKKRLYKKLNGFLKEGVDPEVVKQAIRNKKYVEMYYDDTKPGDEGNPRGKRIIMPLDIGLTKAGNPVIRAYQVNGGNSRSGAPDYIYPRLDRVVSWREMNKTYDAPPDDRYNYYGDKSMSRVDMKADFQLPTQGDVDVARLKNIANGPKVSTKNAQGPVGASQQRKKNVYTSQPNSKKYDMIRQNIDNTEKKGEDFWKLFDLNDAENVMTQQQNQKGPVKDFDENDFDFDENDYINNNRR